MRYPPLQLRYPAAWLWRRWKYGKTWAELRAAGNSRAVQLSIIFPFVGYLILLNDDVVKFLSLRAFEGSGGAVNWKLYFVYFGLMATGLGGAIYQAFCPFIIKKHGDWTDYVRIDGDSFSTGAISALGMALGKKFQDDARGGNPNHVTIDYLREWYSDQSRSLLKARVLVTVLFDVGVSLLAVPSIATALNVLALVVQRR